VIRLNGIGGVTFQNPDRNFDPGFLVEDLVILSEAKNLRSFFCPVARMNGQRCFALLNMTRNAVSIYRTNTFENSCAP